MIEQYTSKKNKICVVGLGYVGLPVALEFARKFSVVGYDINARRVAMMQKAIDPSNELDPAEFEGCDIIFTANPDEIRTCTFFVVAVPTPINEHKNPDLKPLLSACKIVGQALKKGDVAVFESTVYPGCTEEDCVPVLERESGLVFGKDFTVGYSPERINPGDKLHTLTKITKVVSGSDAKTLALVSELYDAIVTAGVHEASSIKVAEASKIIENTQRDLNIALMNELSLIFKKMDINTYEVLEAAGTKWNFLKFSPGLVGGHCIGVDPYYLTHKAMELGYFARVITAGRNINDAVHTQIAKEIVQYLIDQDKSLKQTKVLVMGVTFKENVSDIRNSKVPELIRELQEFKINIDAVDPYADKEEFEHEYGIVLKSTPGQGYDAVVLAVNHEDYLGYDEDYFKKLMGKSGLLYDVKGIFRDRIHEMAYLSL
ncbi:MAG: nucleotide sugar dehydrogenase [Cyclobacteriaceae bacterium]|nr:nucleotide sugar dehydrogenase [Cyclobacteriaceae bacterium]